MSRAERIVAKLHCLGCGRLYQRRDLLFVGVGEDELDLYMRCHCCGCHARLTLPEREGSPRALAAAVPAANPGREERKDAMVVPVTPEDVLQMREFLSTFDGDVERLLGSRCDGP